MSVSPTATVAQHVARAGVAELHDYLARLKAISDGPSKHDDDEKTSHERTSTKMNGVGAHERRQRRSLQPRSSSCVTSSRIKALQSDASCLFGDNNDDESLSSSVCYFRPSGVGGLGGLGIHYAIIKDTDFVQQCASLLLLPSSTSSS
mmetsp:Transcript_35090/g.51468  ORF Transcript_35090/g.51468 Transcript_35090/m.51468 type:complete len:148 (-) Transcript_35090:523-966(-)